MRVERIGIPPDFDMTPDFGFARIHQAQPKSGLPSGVRLPVSAANVQARLRQAGKQCFLTQSRDFLGCRRLAQCQSARQISWSTRSNVSVAAQCRW